MVIGERRKQECELLLESADRKQKLGVLAQSSLKKNVGNQPAQGTGMLKFRTNQTGL